MHEKHLYEYAVIRIVPRVDREEFVNAGVIMFCKKQRFLQTRIEINEQKLRVLSADVDLDQIKQNLQSFMLICEGGKSGGPIAKLDAAERFRWLTAVRSSVIQTSRPHPGMTYNLDDTLQHLFSDMVI